MLWIESICKDLKVRQSNENTRTFAGGVIVCITWPRVTASLYACLHSGQGCGRLSVLCFSPARVCCMIVEVFAQPPCGAGNVEVSICELALEERC